jgi:UDP-N-acetylglucosamine 2-epimerase (hydrolysing)
MTTTMVNPRDILFVSGTRADYGKLEPLALAARLDGHRVTFFVTGMHMMEKYGLTKTEVHREARFEVVEFMNQRDGDPQDIVLAKTVTGFSDYMQEKKPDLVVIHGDRVEALACSLVCAMNYVRCAHVEGGEVSGTIDEIFRHCNSKLSTIHLVSSEDAKRRVMRLGEVEKTIHVIGSPELDIHGRPSGLTLAKVTSRYGIASDDYGICVLHPVTSEVDAMAAQAAALFGALEDSGRYYVVILPNNDPGSDRITEIIAGLPGDRFRVLPSMRFLFFSELLKNARVIVGNSSVGVREAPFLGLASLDVGTRQSNRSSAESVHHCDPLDRDAIARFLEENWGRRYPPHAGFGTGAAAEHFAALLKEPLFWDRPLQKYFNEGPDHE